MLKKSLNLNYFKLFFHLKDTSKFLKGKNFFFFFKFVYLNPLFTDLVSLLARFGFKEKAFKSFIYSLYEFKKWSWLNPMLVWKTPLFKGFLNSFFFKKFAVLSSKINSPSSCTSTFAVKKFKPLLAKVLTNYLFIFSLLKLSFFFCEDYMFFFFLNDYLDKYSGFLYNLTSTFRTKKNKVLADFQFLGNNKTALFWAYDNKFFQDSFLKPTDPILKKYSYEPAFTVFYIKLFLIPRKELGPRLKKLYNNNKLFFFSKNKFSFLTSHFKRVFSVKNSYFYCLKYNFEFNFLSVFNFIFNLCSSEFFRYFSKKKTFLLEYKYSDTTNNFFSHDYFYFFSKFLFYEYKKIRYTKKLNTFIYDFLISIITYSSSFFKLWRNIFLFSNKGHYMLATYTNTNKGVKSR